MKTAFPSIFEGLLIKHTYRSAQLDPIIKDKAVFVVLPVGVMISLFMFVVLPLGGKGKRSLPSITVTAPSETIYVTGLQKPSSQNSDFGTVLFVALVLF